MNMKRWLGKNRVAVLYGGTSAERGISLQTGKAVLDALKKLGADAVGVDAGPDLAFRLRKKKADFAFLALHGPMGEDGTVQGLLEVMGIPYSGCGVLASALAMNKIYSKRVFDAAGLPTPRWRLFDRSSSPSAVKSFPVVVKPATQGSAIGVSVVRSRGELGPALTQALKLDREILVEDYVAGTEITVGVLGDGALPVIEIVPAGKFYDFKSKYQPGQSQHIIPPRLPKRVVGEAQELALRAFRALGCRAVSRVDLIVDRRHKPWLLEINTIPGMTRTSLLPDAAKAAGLTFEALVLRIIEHSVAPA